MVGIWDTTSRSGQPDQPDAEGAGIPLKARGDQGNNALAEQDDDQHDQDRQQRKEGQHLVCDSRSAVHVSLRHPLFVDRQEDLPDPHAHHGVHHMMQAGDHIVGVAFRGGPQIVGKNRFRQKRGELCHDRDGDNDDRPSK